MVRIKAPGSKNMHVEMCAAAAISNPYLTAAGTLACGLSGPRRPYAGAARDFMLGVTLINGKGERLAFGGQVMKNVAGYD